MQYPYYLMAPGPVQMPEEVLQELARPMIHHRTPEFDAILSESFELLKTYFQTSQRVFIQTATGSGGMESALVNVLSPGDSVIAVVSGKFGERWRDMAKVFGMNVISYDVEWGQSADPAFIEELLIKNPQTRAVLTQVCETSTGALHPIEAIGRVVKKYPNCILIADAITALGATPLKIEDWGLDVVVAGSQKAFMIPTGLTFLTFSKKAWSFVESAKCPRFYWDIRLENQSNLKGESHFSSSVTLIRALNAALKKMAVDGLSKQISRCSAMAEATRQGASALGFGVFAASPSPSVTALTVPEGLDGQKIRARLESHYNVTIAGGQDQLKGKIIRIGHLGYIGRKETLGTLERLAFTLNDFGFEASAERAVSKAAEFLREVP